MLKKSSRTRRALTWSVTSSAEAINRTEPSSPARGSTLKSKYACTNVPSWLRSKRTGNSVAENGSTLSSTESSSATMGVPTSSGKTSTSRLPARHGAVRQATETFVRQLDHVLGSVDDADGRLARA